MSLFFTAKSFQRAYKLVWAFLIIKLLFCNLYVHIFFLLWKIYRQIRSKNRFWKKMNFFFVVLFGFCWCDTVYGKLSEKSIFFAWKRAWKKTFYDAIVSDCLGQFYFNWLWKVLLCIFFSFCLKYEPWHLIPWWSNPYNKLPQWSQNVGLA